MSVITFGRDDHTKLTENFERYEFQCPCGCGSQMVDTELASKLQTIRDKLGKKIKITSGYRCIRHNGSKTVKGSKSSRHLYGLAADWRTQDRWRWGFSLRQQGLAASVSTGTVRARLFIPILAAANPHGSAQRPAATPAPVTMLL